jgi:hypothetical protein
MVVIIDHGNYLEIEQKQNYTFNKNNRYFWGT